MKLTECVVPINNIEQYKIAILILQLYSQGKHPGLYCNITKAKLWLQTHNAIYIFLNNTGKLGCVNYNDKIFENYKRIEYKNLINNY